MQRVKAIGLREITLIMEKEVGGMFYRKGEFGDRTPFSMSL